MLIHALLRLGIRSPSVVSEVFSLMCINPLVLFQISLSSVDLRLLCLTFTHREGPLSKNHKDLVLGGDGSRAHH